MNKTLAKPIKIRSEYNMLLVRHFWKIAVLIFYFYSNCIMKSNFDNTWLLNLFIVIWFKRQGIYPTFLTSGFSQMFKQNSHGLEAIS